MLFGTHHAHKNGDGYKIGDGFIFYRGQLWKPVPMLF